MRSQNEERKQSKSDSEKREVLEPLCSDIPVYEIKFSDKTKYEILMAELEKIFKDIDITNKIKFDDDKTTISIYYFPRIFKALIPAEKCIEWLRLLEYEKGKLGNIRYNPYKLLDCFLTEKYRMKSAKNCNSSMLKFEDDVKKLQKNISDVDHKDIKIKEENQ